MYKSVADLNMFFMVFLVCSFSQQEAILEDLRTDIPVHFSFLFSDSHVEVISGKQEGEQPGFSSGGVAPIFVTFVRH